MAVRNGPIPGAFVRALESRRISLRVGSVATLRSGGNGGGVAMLSDGTELPSAGLFSLADVSKHAVTSAQPLGTRRQARVRDHS